MLDVHAPHESIHTWKSFGIHIAAIVVGLIIAVGLEQLVEYVHHHHQVTEMREALRLEREFNRRKVADDARYWRWQTVELQNNLLVLKYLQQHPGTPQEALPGILSWSYIFVSYHRASWDAATQTGIASLMPRPEVAEAAGLYFFLKKVEDASWSAWNAINDAERYTLLDADPSHLSTADIADEISAIEIALTKHYLRGVALQNVHAKFPDFPDATTLDELRRVRNAPDQPKAALLAPARALTEARLKSAGWDPGIAIHPDEPN